MSVVEVLKGFLFLKKIFCVCGVSADHSIFKMMA